MLITDNKAKQIFIPLLKILVAILSIGFILKTTLNQKESFAILFNLIFENSFFVLLLILATCFAFTTCNWAIEILKWQILSAEIHRKSFKNAAIETLSAHAVAILTPHRIGDYGAKMLFFPKRHRKRVLGLNVWNNFAQMAITVFFGCIGLFILLKQFNLARFFKLQYPLLAVLLISLCLFFILLKSSLKKTWIALQFSLNTPLKIKILGFSLLRYLVFSHQFIFLGWLLGWNLTYFTVLPLLFVMYFLASLTPSIFIIDAAVKAGIAIYLFGLISVQSNIILAITASMWTLNFAFPAIIGSIFIWPSRAKMGGVIFKMKVN